MSDSVLERRSVTSSSRLESHDLGQISAHELNDQSGRSSNRNARTGQILLESLNNLGEEEFANE
jgi:hypothetical protein